MDKEQFLRSGLLEQYVLGLTDPEEEELVNNYLERFPELRSEVNNLHQALMSYAANQDIPPPKSVSTSFIPKRRKKSFTGSLVMVPLLLLTGLLVWAYQNGQQHQMEVIQLEAEYAALKTYCEQNQNKLNKAQAIIADSEAILLNPIPDGETYFAIAYWNTKNKACWIDPSQLPALDKGLQYQVWADVNGEMISIGLIPDNAKQLIHLDFLTEAESINVTIEKTGGAEHPTVSLLAVNGLI